MKKSNLSTIVLILCVSAIMRRIAMYQENTWVHNFFYNFNSGVVFEMVSFILILLVNMFTTLDTYTDLCTFQTRYKNRKRYYYRKIFMQLKVSFVVFLLMIMIQMGVNLQFVILNYEIIILFIELLMCQVIIVCLALITDQFMISLIVITAIRYFILKSLSISLMYVSTVILLGIVSFYLIYRVYMVKQLDYMKGE